jgi:hypothetical protein
VLREEGEAEVFAIAALFGSTVAPPRYRRSWEYGDET